MHHHGLTNMSMDRIRIGTVYAIANDQTVTADDRIYAYMHLSRTRHLEFNIEGTSKTSASTVHFDPCPRPKKANGDAKMRETKKQGTHSLLPPDDLSHIQDLARYLADDALGSEEGYYCGPISVRCQDRVMLACGGRKVMKEGGEE